MRLVRLDAHAESGSIPLLGRLPDAFLRAAASAEAWRRALAEAGQRDAELMRWIVDHSPRSHELVLTIPPAHLEPIARQHGWEPDDGEGVL